MVLIKGTGRGRCTCGTPTEIEMQNIRDASEEAVREAREALRIAGEAQDTADGAQDTLDDIMDGTATVPMASIATNLPYSAKRITGTPNDFYVFRYGKIVYVKVNGITLAKGVTSTFGIGEFPHPLYDSTVGGYASSETNLFGTSGTNQPIQVWINANEDSLKMRYNNGPDDEYNIAGYIIYLSDDPV